VPGDALQASQHVAQVTAEHAAIRVQLVDHHVLQVLEELGPARMVRQYPRVQHVGVGERDVRPRADGLAGIRRRVAVVGVHADRLAARLGDERGELVQLGHLVLRQGLGREEIQRARRRILEDRIQHRQVVAERLARRRRRGDDDVLAIRDARERLGLMRVELCESALLERRLQPRLQRVGERRVLRVHRRHPAHGRDDPLGCVWAFEPGPGREVLEGPVQGLVLALDERGGPGQGRLLGGHGQFREAPASYSARRGRSTGESGPGPPPADLAGTRRHPATGIQRSPIDHRVAR
jgi:hypothetical protein